MCHHCHYCCHCIIITISVIVMFFVVAVEVFYSLFFECILLHEYVCKVYLHQIKLTELKPKLT